MGRVGEGLGTHEERMQMLLNRVAFLVFGWVTVLAGIIALFIPIIPGTLFLLIGAIILSSEYIFVRKVLERLRMRFPVFDRAFKNAFVMKIGGIALVTLSTLIHGLSRDGSTRNSCFGFRRATQTRFGEVENGMGNSRTSS
jgi:Kef-type K+ transport system membrane component KefB